MEAKTRAAPQTEAWERMSFPDSLNLTVHSCYIWRAFKSNHRNYFPKQYFL